MNADQNPLNALVAQIAEQVTQEVCERIREQAPAILREVLAEYPPTPHLWRSTVS